MVSPVTAVVAGGASGALVTELMDTENETILSLIYKCLDQIETSLNVIQTWGQRERQKTPEIVEISAVYVAGAIASQTPFIFPSTFRCEHLILSGINTAGGGGFPLIIRLTIGTRAIIFPFGSGIGNAFAGGIDPIPFPVTINGGTQVAFRDVVGLGPGNVDQLVWVYFIGHYERVSQMLSADRTYA